MTSELLRHLAAVHTLEQTPAVRDAHLPNAQQTALCRDVLAQVRTAIQQGLITNPQDLGAAVQAQLVQALEMSKGQSLRRVHNGLGILLHTNAGRAPLGAEALAAIVETAKGYSNLEFDLQSGERSSRQDAVKPLLRWLTGAQDALVVNNGAAAVLLALHAVARGRQVVVSRGELVEIGGGFRIPEVMAAAGCRLHEVGTTNRTHLSDYENAGLDAPDVAAWMQVHRANFAQIGFVATPKTSDLAALAHRLNLPLLVDLGSGALSPLQVAGAELHGDRREPCVSEVLADGADLVCFSGDKLLGGPQCGVLVGDKTLIAAAAKAPLARALRVDNLTLAALQTVLSIHFRGDGATLPVLAAAALPQPEVMAIAEALRQQLTLELGHDWQIDCQPTQAQLGGGTDPRVDLPSMGLRMAHTALSASRLALGLRMATPPVLSRVRDRMIVLDIRSLLAGSSDLSTPQLGALLAECLRQAFQPR